MRRGGLAAPAAASDLRQHRLQERQGHDRAEAPEHRPPRNPPAVAHGCVPSRGPHLERFALDHSDDQSREPVVVLVQGFHDLVHRATVVILQAAAQGVGQQLLGQTAAEQVFLVP